MNIPDELRYTKDHEWLKMDDGEVLIGITDYAQSELGDIVYLELPDVGTDVTKGSPFGTIEAVKAAADMFSPISGEVTAVNGLLDQSPELINQSPYDEGWIIRIKPVDPAEIETMLTPVEYKELIDG